MKIVMLMIVLSIATSIVQANETPLRKVDPAQIAEPVAEIVEHIVILAQNSDNKDHANKKEVALQATAGLLINAIKIVFAATNRGIACEQLEKQVTTLMESFSEDELYAMDEAIVASSKRIPCLTQ